MDGGVIRRAQHFEETGHWGDVKVTVDPKFELVLKGRRGSGCVARLSREAGHSWMGE